MADVTRTIEIVVDTNESTQNVDELNKSLDQNTKEIKQNENAQDSYQKTNKDTAGSLEGVVGWLDDMTGGLISNVKAIAQNVKGLKTLKVALAATGIGAIAVAVGTLITAFKRLPGPMRLVEDVFNAIDGAIDAAIGQLGTFAAAIQAALTNQWQLAAALISTATQEIIDTTKERFELSQEERAYEKRQAEELLRLSELERRIEQLKLISEDQSKTDSQRLEAANAAYALQQQRVSGLIALEKERIELDRQLAEARIETDEEYIERLAREQEGNERIATLEGQLVELNNSRQGLIKEINDKLREQTGIVNDLTSAYGEWLDVSIDRTSEFTDNLETLNKQLDEAAQSQYDANQAVEETGKEAEKTQQDLAGALTTTGEAAQGVLDIIAGKTTGKDVFKFFLTSISSILGLFSGAGPAAGIFSAIGGLFADGGMIKGPSHAGGGVWVNAEGGEAVINKRSMAIPGVSDIASYLNELGGGVKFADGGIIPTPTGQEQQLAAIQNAISQQIAVLPIPDLITETTKVQVIEDRATLE